MQEPWVRSLGREDPLEKEMEVAILQCQYAPLYSLDIYDSKEIPADLNPLLNKTENWRHDQIIVMLSVCF